MVLYVPKQCSVDVYTRLVKQVHLGEEMLYVLVIQLCVTWLYVIVTTANLASYIYIFFLLF